MVWTGPDPDRNIQGAKLATITQAITYRGIQRQKPRTPHLTTNRNIDLAREAIEAHTGSLETTESIWKSIRKCSIQLRAQQFLYKAIHNTPMIGEFWFNIDGYQHRGRCAPCDATENMDHILTSCRARHAEHVWELAKDLWPHEDSQWPDIN